MDVPRKHPLAECEKCPLYEIGSYVGSDGPQQAQIAFVGEAPGGNEAQVGKPFIGVSGRLLNQVLQHYQIRRSDVFLTNAALCRPPENATPSAAALKEIGRAHV